MVDDNLLKELNPWKEIPVSAPFVLPQDRIYINRYNENLSISDESYLHSELYPEQYAGKFELLKSANKIIDRINLLQNNDEVA